MNDEVEVTIFQAMIQYILQLTLQWLLIQHLSVKIHSLKAMFSIAFSVNTSSDVFYNLVGPGQSLQSQKKQFVRGGLQFTVDNSAGT
jgi:hypothetical protein